MTENISAKQLILKVFTWKKIFMWITIVSALVTGVIVILLPKQYKSTAIVFPARQFSVSKLVIEANAGNQEDYMMYGDADDCEKLMQIFQCDEIKIKVADAFHLWDRWRIKDTIFALHYLKQKWDDQVRIKRTEYNSIKIEVHDYTADSAAFVANGISDYCDTIRYAMNRRLSGEVLKIVKVEYDSTVARMKVLEDSLDALRALGVFHYKEQVKAYSKSYAKALADNDQAAMKRIESKMDTLKKYGGAYQNMHDNLERYGSKYPDIKMKYDEAVVNYNTLLPNKFVVERAKSDEYKSRPRRLIIIGITVLAANLMGLFFLLFRERFGKEEH